MISTEFLNSLLTPYTLIFLAAFLCGVTSPHFRNRRKMMLFKFLGDGLSSIYLFLMGGTSGACAAMIAGTGALIQAITPHQYINKTKWFRVGAATALSVASIFFVYKTPTDLLPLSMVIICRFAELQKEAQKIRFVYWITCFPWIAYFYLNEIYLPFCSCCILCVSLLWSIIRHQKALNSIKADTN